MRRIRKARGARREPSGGAGLASPASPNFDDDEMALGLPVEFEDINAMTPRSGARAAQRNYLNKMLADEGLYEAAYSPDTKPSRKPSPLARARTEPSLSPGASPDRARTPPDRQATNFCRPDRSAQGFGRVGAGLEEEGTPPPMLFSPEALAMATSRLAKTEILAAVSDKSLASRRRQSPEYGPATTPIARPEPEVVPSMVAKLEEKPPAPSTQAQRQFVLAIGSDPTSASSAEVLAWWNSKKTKFEGEKPRSFAKALREDVGGEGEESLTPRGVSGRRKVLTPRSKATRWTVDV